MKLVLDIIDAIPWQADETPPVPEARFGESLSDTHGLPARRTSRSIDAPFGHSPKRRSSATEPYTFAAKLDVGVVEQNKHIQVGILS